MFSLSVQVWSHTLLEFSLAVVSCRGETQCVGDVHQTRPLGLSLKNWVGREKALASAGHVSPRTP